jgi:hypothetical protein
MIFICRGSQWEKNEGINVRSWHFGDIEAAPFNVRFRASFGHQRIARSCRRMTPNGHVATAAAVHGKGLAGRSAQPEAALGSDKQRGRA